MVAKELELARKNKGTFRRSAPKQKNRAKWTHTKYQGWIRLTRGTGEVVEIEVRTKKGAEWQLLRAVLGFIDRHFGPKVGAINIRYAN